MYPRSDQARPVQHLHNFIEHGSHRSTERLGIGHRGMLTIGASHRSATPTMLGDFGRAAREFRAGVRDGIHVRSRIPVHELAVLATCARVEVYAVTETSAAEEAVRAVRREVFGSGETAYHITGPDSVRHLCRVAAGLESFVVGEHEIAGQVQRAFKDVVCVSGGRNVLEGAAAVARRASRRVRSETGIGRYPASVSSVAVDLVRDRLGDLATRRALVVGAGRAGRLVALNLRSSGIGSLVVVNRSLDRALEVAQEVGGDAAELGLLAKLLPDADVVVTATGAEGVLIDVATAEVALRARPPAHESLLLVDLALPGDVEPAVGALDRLELLTLEDVQDRVRRHISLRRGELQAAGRVVDAVVDDFLRQQETPDMDGIIGELRRSIEELRSAEVERWLGTRGSESAPSRDQLDQLTRSIVNKLLHEPMRRLRSTALRSGGSGEQREPAPPVG